MILGTYPLVHLYFGLWSCSLGYLTGEGGGYSLWSCNLGYPIGEGGGYILWSCNLGYPIGEGGGYTLVSGPVVWAIQLVKEGVICWSLIL